MTAADWVEVLGVAAVGAAAALWAVLTVARLVRRLVRRIRAFFGARRIIAATDLDAELVDFLIAEGWFYGPLEDDLMWLADEVREDGDR